MGRRTRRRGVLWALGLAALVGVAVLVATSASAHIERASYWPDPAPDTSVTPPAGGKVPTVRSLFTALQRKPPGATRVVCQGRVPHATRVNMLTRKLRAANRRYRKTHSASKRRAARPHIKSLRRKLKAARKKYRARVNANLSIKSLKRAIATARKNGYKFRPTESPRKLTKAQAKKLLAFNVRLLGRCRFHLIQSAVTAVAQQRPRGDHARHLRRAEVALRSRPTTPSAPTCASRTTATRRAPSPTPTSGSAPTTRT